MFCTFTWTANEQKEAAKAVQRPLNALSEASLSTAQRHVERGRQRGVPP